MININKNNIKIYSVLILTIVMIALIIFACIYAIKNHNRDDILTLKNFNATYTLNEDQLDNVEQPIVSENITSDSLPKADDNLQEININTLKKLFQTSKKSILVLEKNDCSYCDDFEPKIIQALKEYNINAYKINISNLQSSDFTTLFKYINYEGTPTTYIIQNSKVLHNLTGTTDLDTLKAFIDYFYIRNN